jgi:predicted dehydrogenase
LFTKLAQAGNTDAERKGTDMIRIGILGAARIAPAAMIAPAAARDDCRVVAVAARGRGRARAFATAHSIGRVIASYEALVTDPGIDLVYNALPPHRHADLTMAALAAGKAVLCEKPFAMNAGEAAAMAAAAARHGRPLIEAFHYRFHPMFVQAQAQVQAGVIGKVQHVAAAFSVPIPYRAGELRHTLNVGGGATMDLGCYPVHWARTLIGGAARVIKAEAVLQGAGIDGQMTAQLAFDNGATATVMCDMREGVKIAAFAHVTGSGGDMRLINPLQPAHGAAIKLNIGGVHSEDVFGGETTYVHQLAHVMDVLAGRAAQVTGGTDAVDTMRIIDDIYRAAGMHPRGLENLDA